MAKTKLNAFYDSNAKKVTEDDVKDLLKMQNNAQQIATNEQNKATNKAPNRTTLPSLDDTSKKGNTTPSVSSNNADSIANNTFKNATRPQQKAQAEKEFTRQMKNSGYSDKETQEYLTNYKKNNNVNKTTNLGAWDKISDDDKKALTDVANSGYNTKGNNKGRATERAVSSKMKELQKKYNLTDAEVKDATLSFKSEYRTNKSNSATEKASEYAKEHPVLGTAKSFVSSAGVPLEALGNLTAGALKGDDRYLDNSLLNKRQAQRESASSNIKSTLGKGAYNVATGLGDLGLYTLESAATGGAINPFALSGLSTGEEAQNSAIDRGVDTRSSSMYGIGAGTLDYLLNKKGIDIAKNRIGANPNALVKNILAGAGDEAMENVTQDALQTVLDELISGDNSELKTSYNNYLTNGMSKTDAIKQVAKDYAGQLGTSATIGGLMGGAFTGGKQLSNSLSDLNKTIDFSNIPSLEQKAEMPNRTPDLYASNMYSLINNLNDDVNVGKVNSDIDRVNADRIRQSNPELLGKLSDEDVLKWDAMTNRDANIDNQNYNTLVNVMNNTDNSVNGIKSNGVEDTTGLDFMSNDSPVYDFRQNNPELSRNMSDEDIANYLNAQSNDRFRSYEDLISQNPYYQTKEYTDISSRAKELHQLKKEIWDEMESIDKQLNQYVDADAMNGDRRLAKSLGLYTPEGEALSQKYKALREQRDSYDAEYWKLSDEMDNILRNARANELQNYSFDNNFKPLSQADYEGFDLTKGTNSEVQDAINNGTAKIVEMTPEEYLNRVTYDIFNTSTRDSAIAGIEDRGNVRKYAEAMRNGDKFPILNLTYDGRYGRGQEGRTRALAAYEAGIDKVPVAILGEPSENTSNIDLLRDYTRINQNTNVDIPNNIRSDIDTFMSNSNLTDAQKNGINYAINRYYATGEMFNLTSAEKLASQSGASDLSMYINKMITDDIDNPNSPYGIFSQNVNGAEGTPEEKANVQNILRNTKWNNDVTTEAPTLTQAEYDSRIADFNQRNTVKGIVGEYLNKNTFKGVKFDGEGSTKANASIKNFTQILERLDDINDINELNDYVANELSPAFKEMKEAISQGYVIDNTSVKENEKLRKQLREALKGRKILITPDVEAEFPNMTIREMNNKVGVNAFTKKSDIGSPIDMGRFAEISDETGNALGIADGPNAELIQRIFDYADSLKNAEPTRVNVDANAATRELLGEAQEVIDAKRTLLNELGSRPEGLIDETDIRPEAYTNRLDELPKANVNFGDIDEVETSGKPLLTSEEVEAILRGMGNDTESVPSFDTSRIETVNNVTRPLATLEPKQNTTVKKVDTSPSMVNSVPVIDSPTLKERGYSESIREKTDLPDEIKKEFATNPEMYEVLHNSQTQARADYILDNNDIDGALNETLKLLSTKDPTALPLGYNVSKMLIDNGRRDDAEALLRMMSESLTESGQFSQAAAITMMHNDPMTALRYMQKEIDRLNVEGQKKYKKNWKDFSLTDDEIDMFNNLEQGDAEGIKNAYDQVGKRLSKEYPSSNWEKFVELTKLSMLLNPRTHIRNFSANGLLLPMRSASDRISALGQNAAKLLGSDAEVTQSLVGGTKEQKRIAGEIFDNDFKDLLSGDDKWDSLQGVARQKQVFNNSKAGWYATEGAYRGVGLVNKLTGGKLDGVLSQMDESMTDSTLENLRRFDYYLLSTVEDDPFVKANFVNRLASYMKAQNINSIDDVPAEAKSLAWQESLKATFKDDNNLTRMLGNMKKELGKFGEVLFPFTKTPANLAARAADYSPIGIAKALADYYKMPVNQRNIGKMWDDMSKGITGTSGILLGYALAKSGVITGALSDDADEQQFQKQQGMQQYSLHLGDKYYSYDWAQPAGTPLIMGATIYDALKNSDEEESNALKKLANGTWEGSKAAFDAWFDLSPLQTVQELLSGDEYGSTSGGIADRVVDTITGMPQRLIPSLMGATARTVDPTMRETYDKNSAVKTWVNEAKAKVPAIGDDDNWWNTNVSSKSLPAKYDTWGNERKRSDTVGQAAFAQYVNPGQLSNSNITPIDNAIVELGNNIADEKTKQKIYPRKASWTVNGQTLTNEEHSDYQKELGQTSYKLAEKLINSEGFNSLSYEDKAEALNDMYNLADKITQQKLFGKEISNKNDIENANLYEKDIDKLISNYNNKNTLNTYAGDYKDKEGNNLSYNGLSKDKKVEVLEKAYNNGEITSEQLADYIPDDKVAKALSNYDNGTQIYLDLVKNAYTDNRFDLDKALPVLMKTNASYDEVGSVIYAMQSTKSTTKLNQVHSEKGNEGVLDYTMYKKYADADGNGSLKNTEITNYLNSINLTNDERRYWYSVLAKNNNKNPY